MGKQLENEVEYYYDSHPTEEDLMGESVPHAYLVRYLVLVLQHLFQGQVCGIYDNLNFYQTGNDEEHPLAPDVALVKGLPLQVVTSWKLGRTGPAPQVVFEIASEKTWKNDRGDKVDSYADIGVEEYFFYDPNDPPLWRDIPHRLLGWYLEKANQRMWPIPRDERGRLWSAQLDSWLAPDQDYLRLYDRSGNMRLTGEEAEAEARRAETKRADAEATARRAEARRADAEAKLRQALAEKLRSLGINPDEIV